MTNQNKAHAVNVGSVYKPNGKSGLINVASDDAIINHFTLKIQARKYLSNDHATGDTATLSRRESIDFRSKYGNKKTGAGIGGIGYNENSKKSWQCPAPEYGGFVLPSFNLYALNGRAGSQSLGVWVRSNPPDCPRQFRAPPPLTGGYQSKNRGGHHA